MDAPYSHDNPSITDIKGLSAESEGRYLAFDIGKLTMHANYLLEQLTTCSQSNYVLAPNKHVCAWNVGFMPQWLMREYFARRGKA